MEHNSQKILKINRPLVSFDLETTGLDVAQDKIVEISCVKREPNGQRSVLTHRLNPGVSIPKHASDVHGIYDEDIKDKPFFQDIHQELLTFLDGCDLTGFNCQYFDVPMLQAEFKRVGVEFPRPAINGQPEINIVDSHKIYVMKEARTLSAAVQFYCNRTLEGAHSAEADASAALDVLEAQIAKYEDLPNDIAALKAYCKPKDWVDDRGKVIKKDGQHCLSFGKHRNKPLVEIAKTDAGYLEWLLKADFSKEVKSLVQNALS